MICSPDLESAKKRKWWLLITAAIENLLFGQLLFGWSSLLLMLKGEHFYAYLCPGNQNITGENSTVANHSGGGHEPPHAYLLTSGDFTARRLLSGGGPPVEGACAPQDEILNVIYTICLFSQTGSGFIIGTLQDSFGYKIIRLVGSLLFVISNLLFIFVDASMSWAIIPLLVLGAIGGTSMVFTSFQISNLFGSWRGTVMGVVVGAMSSSAVMFAIFKALYDEGMAFSTMWIFFTVGGIWTFLNCVFTWPSEVIPIPEELKAVLYLYQTAGAQRKDKQFIENLKQVGRRMSHTETTDMKNMWSTSNPDLTKSGDDKEETFFGVLCSALFFLGLLFMSIVFLRLLLYIGTMYLALLKLTDVDTMSEYVKMFGYLQVLCLPVCPVMNWLLDRGTKPSQIVAADEKELSFILRTRKLKNCQLVFFINSSLIIIFGICTLIPVLQVQVVSFITHTVLRGTGMSAVLGMFAVCFPFQFLGKMVGLLILMSAFIDLVQSPLFLLINGALEGDPFWIDVALFALSFLCFSLPLYLLFFVKKLKKNHEREKCAPGTKNSVMKMAEGGDPFAKRLSISLDNPELFI